MPSPTARTLNYISYGAGVQSTALLICSNLGLHGVPRADVAIFADTQDEPAWVYETLERARAWSEIPVEVVTAGCLSKHALEKINVTRSRFASIPLFVDSASSNGMGRRQCTREHKIDPILRRVPGVVRGAPREEDALERYGDAGDLGGRGCEDEAKPEAVGRPHLAADRRPPESCRVPEDRRRPPGVYPQA